VWIGAVALFVLSASSCTPEKNALTLLNETQAELRFYVGGGPLSSARPEYVWTAPAGGKAVMMYAPSEHWLLGLITLHERSFRHAFATGLSVADRSGRSKLIPVEELVRRHEESCSGCYLVRIDARDLPPSE